jgi:hypothetical protein
VDKPFYADGVCLDELPFYDQFTLGGWSGLSGYPYQRFQGPYYALFRLGYDRKVGKLTSLLGRGVYALAWGEAGNVWQIEELTLSFSSGTLALGADTILARSTQRQQGGNEPTRLYSR